MSITIESLYSQVGYNDIIDFLNSEITSPTSGFHSTIVDEIVTTLALDDYYIYVQEVYSDPSTYKGVFFITSSHKFLYLENKQPIYIQLDDVEVKKIALMQTDGLDKLYSAIATLDDNVTGDPAAEQQIYFAREYGSDVIYAHLRISNEIQGTGLVLSQVTEDQELSNFNAKIDKTPYAVLKMIAARNQYTKFKVELVDGIYDEFIYTAIGQIMFVQDTAKSREILKLLARQGIIFIEF